VGVEAPELLLDRIGSAAADRNAGIDQSDQQLTKSGSNLMTAALHRRRAGAAGQVFVNEALDDLVGKVSNTNAAATRPVRKMRHAVHVHTHRPGRVVSIDQAAHVGRHEQREIAVAQPRRRHRMNGLERIHGDLLKWGCPRRRRLLLCAVQTSLAPPQALTRLVVSAVTDDKFA